MEPNNTPNALIVGGSSGLGLELAYKLWQTHRVIVTGRRDPKEPKLTFRECHLDQSQEDMAGEFVSELADLADDLPPIDLLIYAAGFFQEGRIDTLSDDDISSMINIGILAPTVLLNRLLKKQNKLPGFIAITSTSQWTPRLLEPVYTAVKAGLGMLASSISLDERVGKVLVAGPAGMKTRFWEASPRDMSAMLDPDWVAAQILEQYAGNFEYKFVRILRGPSRVEIVETR